MNDLLERLEALRSADFVESGLAVLDAVLLRLAEGDDSLLTNLECLTFERNAEIAQERRENKFKLR